MDGTWIHRQIITNGADLGQGNKATSLGDPPDRGRGGCVEIGVENQLQITNWHGVRSPMHETRSFTGDPDEDLRRRERNRSIETIN